MAFRIQTESIMGVLVALIILFFLIPSTAVSQELTATEIMEKVDNADDGESSSSEMTMILIDRRGNQRVRQM
jgi:hypothetical protein